MTPVDEENENENGTEKSEEFPTLAQSMAKWSLVEANGKRNTHKQTNKN